MRLETAIGTVVLETDWHPLLHFFDQQRTAWPPLEDRVVVVRVELVDSREVDTSPNDPPDAYPRSVHLERSRFVLWRDRVEGKVARDLPTCGVLLAWLWSALPILCAPEGWECLHAAAVDTDAGAAIILGGSHTGKSTTALDMMGLGARHFSDDRVLVDAEGTTARSWGALFHADPRAARSLGWEAFTQDAFGKVWIPVPSPAIRNQAPIAAVYSTGGKVDLRDEGPGWDSGWVNDYGVARRLLAAAKPVPCDRLEARIAITNRNPWRAPTKWEGGDMTEIWGWLEGLRANGIVAEFVPWDELEEGEWDLIHLWHTQFPWSRHVAEHTTRPLVVTAITQGDPDPTEVAPAVRRASAVLCYSALEEEWYAKRFPELPSAFRHYAPGVSAATYEREAPVTPTCSVFQAGRYSPVKNQIATLQACRDLDVPVVFAGMTDPESGEYLAALRREAGDWKGVRFFGVLKGEVLRRRFRAAHVHAQPSRWETFGVATLEALAFGCNVIHTSHGLGYPIHGRYGTICEPDLDGVRAALQCELSVPRDRHRFRPPTWERAVRAALPIYREALDGS